MAPTVHVRPGRAGSIVNRCDMSWLNPVVAGALPQLLWKRCRTGCQRRGEAGPLAGSTGAASFALVPRVTLARFAAAG